MALRSGIGAQLGFATESTWGTRVTPTRFLEFVTEGINLSVDRIESKAVRASNRVMRSDRWVAGARSAGGPIEWEVSSNGFGLLFKHILGAIAITTPVGATLTRDHTATLGDFDNLGMTVQIGRPDVNGTVRPFEYRGAKVTDWELSIAANGLLMLKTTIDAVDEDTSQALATVSYPVSQSLLSYVGGTITIGGPSVDVSDFNVHGSNGLKTDRRLIRNATTKKEQIPHDLTGLSGSITAEFEDLTAYSRFVNGTVATITALFEGATIEGALKYGVLVTLPACRFDGDTPNVGGNDILPIKLPFKVLNDGTNPPISIRYRTTDTVS